MMRRALLAVAFVLAWPLAAGAFEIDEPLADPALEARAQGITEQLRCLVCQNQSVAESDADLAKDIRRLVRERLAGGETDAQVVGYMVSRYGDFILLKPPVKATTYLLWFGPALVLLAGALGVFVYLRRRGREAATGEAAPLTEAERARLAALLEGERKP